MIEMTPIRMSTEYGFLNSHYFCLDEWSEPLKEYDFLLKTDCDVFLTHNLIGYTPSKLHVGQGNYYNSENIKKIDFIKKICDNFNFKYKHMSNIGASFFGRTDYVLYIVKNQALITEHILKNYFIESDIDDESGFHKGISSMIAGEVIVNAGFSQQHVSLYTIDSKCWESTLIGSDVLHIHAWHTTQKWSKHQFFNGDYNDWVVDEKDMNKSASDYCQFFANLNIEEVILNN
jgi:hypothetical protein